MRTFGSVVGRFSMFTFSEAVWPSLGYFSSCPQPSTAPWARPGAPKMGSEQPGTAMPPLGCCHRWPVGPSQDQRGPESDVGDLRPGAPGSRPAHGSHRPLLAIRLTAIARVVCKSATAPSCWAITLKATRAAATSPCMASPARRFLRRCRRLWRRRRAP